jgi:4-hydroxy-4-methyl-2-oxoglutarate aldolase
MGTNSHLTAAQCEAIQAFDTCKIANAIERLGLRLKNEGFTLPGLQCRIGGFPSVVGYAVTSRVRSADPPVCGYTCHDLKEWWAEFERYPAPRVAVVEDVDKVPGQGAVLSNLHAEVLRALHCRGLVTNGAVRNIAHLEHTGFPTFSAHVAVSHSYVHMIEYSVPVEIFGLLIRPGDLIFVDCHGAITIPEEHCDQIVRLAAEMVAEEQRVIDLCRSGSFTISALFQAARNL